MGGSIAGFIGRTKGQDRRTAADPVVGGTRSRTVGWAAAAALACVPLLFLTLAPSVLTGRMLVEFEQIDDLNYSVADRVSQGKVPYRDFPLEYPIGCLPQLVLPIVAGHDIPTYRAAYIAEMLLVNAALVLALAVRVEHREGPAAVPRRLAWYLVCYLFLGRLIVSRLDVVPALLAFLAAVGWSGGRPIRGGVLAAVGAMVKLVPALAVLPAGIRELARLRQTRLRGSIAFACVFVLGVAAWALVGGSGMLKSIRYHGERGLEIESVGAGVLMIWGKLTGAAMASRNAFGSTELHSALSPAAVAASRPLQLLALAVTLVPFVRSGRRSGVQCTGALLLAFIATAPVLSPQFLIWVLPFVLAMGGPLGGRVRPLFVVACALSFALYPVYFHRGLQHLTIPAVAILNARNALVIALWALMAFGPSGDGEDAADRPRIRSRIFC